jgi:hypothetical protein
MTILDQIKLYHWQTLSYPRHKATDELHEELSSLVDKFVEVLHGRLNNDNNKYRIMLEENSNIPIKNMNDNIDCVIRYGSYFNPVNYKVEDCITGLIGMRCKYIKKIIILDIYGCIEWYWAKSTYLMDDKNIILMNNLGINICPGSDKYFLV